MKASHLFTTKFSALISKLGTGLAAVAVAMVLLLGTSPARAVEVIVEDGSVTRINNLLVPDSEENADFYDVVFRSATGFQVYGDDLNDFDFNTEENVFLALFAVLDALNSEVSPIPGSAGPPPGTDVFYIGAEEDANTDGFIGAVGGENFGEFGWEACEEPNCLVGVAVLAATEILTYANFTLAPGDGNLPPVADANGPYEAAVDEPVAFDGADSHDTDGNIESWNWNFGDGHTGTGEKTSHTYDTADIWNVTLEVVDNMGARDSDGTTATIGQGAPDPLADAGGPYLYETGVIIEFDGTGSTTANPADTVYNWDFGDTTLLPDAGPTPEHAYTSEGLYEVKLTVIDNLGGGMDDDIAYSVIGAVGEPPTADANGPYEGAVDVAIDFDGSTSTGGDGTIADDDYVWTFGDGTGDRGAKVSHIYTTTGTFNVNLFVQNSNGGVDRDETTATTGTGNLPPVADANGPYPGEVGVAVNFDGAGSSDPEGEIVSYIWNFGDGTTGSGRTTTHTYTTAKNYFVTLTVTDAANATDSAFSVAGIEPASGGQPPVIPIPPALWLFGSALGILAWLRRKAR